MIPPDYFTLLTDTGTAAWAFAQAHKLHLPITHIAIGDGGGQAVTPQEGMTALIHEVCRAPVSCLSVDVGNPNWLIAEAVFPAETGGWMIRETGLIGGFDATDPAHITPGGDLLAIGNFPETYKPRLSQGAGKDLVVRMIIEVGNAEIVNLTLDPSVVVATRKTVEQAFANHRAEENPHPQYLTIAQARVFLRARRFYFATH